MIDDVHERRRERNRVAQAEARKRSRETGEPMGHALDAVIIDGLALTLAGRDVDDPVRVAIEREISRACWARRVAATPVLARRLQSRLAISPGLRGALSDRRFEARQQK